MTLNVLLLGERLRACRIAKGCTMKEFAEKYDISERYLADLERGKKAPKLDTLVRISNSIGVSPEYLLQDSLLLEEDPSREIRNIFQTLTLKQQKILIKFLVDFTSSCKA